MFQEQENVDKNNQSVGIVESTQQKHPVRNLFIAVLIVILSAAVVWGALTYRASTNTPERKPTVKVGVLMAFTGGSSSMGYGAMKGIQLAKKQLEANNIELIQADSKCDPKIAVESAKKLIKQGVAAIIGDGCSSASVAVLPQINNSKVVLLSPSASSATLSIPNDYFFRDVPPDNFQAEFMAQAMKEKGISSVGVFYTNEPYGSGMNKVFQEKFASLGGKVVATAYAEPDVIDLNTQMQQLKKAGPQAIFIAPNSVVSATAAIQVARQNGITAPLFGADIFYDRTVINNAPQAAEGLTITSFPTGTDKFKQMLFNEYKITEQLYAAPQAYDAFETIYKAVNQGAKSGEQIKAAIPSIRFKGMSADISYDKNGEISDPHYRYDLLQVKNGAFVEIE